MGLSVFSRSPLLSPVDEMASAPVSSRIFFARPAFRRDSSASQLLTRVDGGDPALPRFMLKALASYGLAKLLGGGLFLALVIYLLFSVVGR